MQNGEYYELIAPDVWKKADPYKEYSYTETIDIVDGRGKCKAASTADYMSKLGYKVIHHRLVENKPVSPKTRKHVVVKETDE